MFGIDTPSLVGLIAGALTSTPGLAVAIDSTQSPLASIAYGIAYPFGVIGVILFVKLLPKMLHVDLEQEARRLEKERRSQFPELGTCLFKVTNPTVNRPYTDAAEYPCNDRSCYLSSETR